MRRPCAHTRTQIIQRTYDPLHPLPPLEQQRLQNELFEVQKKHEAWALVAPFLLSSPDPNVKFFGAHTAQVKIARDWFAVCSKMLLSLF